MLGTRNKVITCGFVLSSRDSIVPKKMVESKANGLSQDRKVLQSAYGPLSFRNSARREPNQVILSVEADK
jgi:hypothetical protein